MMTDNNSFHMEPEAQHQQQQQPLAPPPPSAVVQQSPQQPHQAISTSGSVAQPILIQQTQQFSIPVPNTSPQVITKEELNLEPDENYPADTDRTYQSDTKPTILVRPPSQQDNNRSTIGRLCYLNEVLYITEGATIDIGRNSSTSNVHFHIGQNNFISRKHFQIIHDNNNNDIYIVVVSKNGIFIDEHFCRKSHEPERLPRSCQFRFPSTDIRILFESFLEKDFNEVKSIKPIDHINGGLYSPLKIKIPKSEKKSPPPSPSGTISAANSCPTSPRQSFREYQHNNNNNNNGYQNSDPLAPSSSQNDYEKPLYSYAQLIVQSISASPEKQLTLSGIYSFITKNYPYYRKEANKGWQNSIRHNLSLNRYFLKVERSQDEPGKGSFWRIDPNSEAKLIDQSYRKRRQRGSQCFRTPYGMPRSAPASPSHIDHSRDSSPLHDIILQSAPGSPQATQQTHTSTTQPIAAALGGGGGGVLTTTTTAANNINTAGTQRNATANVPIRMWPE